MNGSETGLEGTGTLTNVNNTIRGAGVLAVDVVNQNVVVSENGRLQVADGFLLDNDAGRVEVAATGVLDLSSTAVLLGGELSSEVGGQVEGGVLRDLTVTGELSQSVGRTTTLQGTIMNTGTLTFQSDNFNNVGGQLDTRALIDSAVTLSGGGTVALNGSETGLEGTGTLTNVNNTIRGVGVLAVDVVNQNVVMPENGRLQVADGFLLDNDAGRVEVAATGVLDLSSTAVLLGGELSSEVGGQVEGGVLRDLTVTGELSQSVGRTTTLQGTITNAGTLTFQSDNFNNLGGQVDTRFLIDTDVTLTGGGLVVLNGSETGFEGAGTLINVDNVIRATGNSQLSVNLESAGSGEIELIAGSVLDFNSSTVSGGTLNGLGGLHREGTLDNITIDGTLTQQVGTSTTYQGTITNAGTLTFQSDNFNNVGGQVDTRALINSAVTLSGGGTVALNGSETGLEGTGTLTNVNNTIRGTGVLAVDVVNSGTLYADSGRLSFTEDLDLTFSSLVDVLLEGSSFVGSGNISASGEVDLSGTLGLVAGESFDAAIGQTFRILTADSLGGTEFLGIDQSAAGEYTFDVTYGDGFVEIEVVDFVTGTVNTNGDFDNDGDVDAEDIDSFLLFSDNAPARGELDLFNLNLDGVITETDRAIHINSLVETSNGQVGTFFGDINLDGTVDVLGDAFILVGNLGSSSALYSDGDVNGDGRVDVLGDSFALVSNLGSTNAAGSSFLTATAVPEPSSVLVFGLFSLTLLSRRRAG